MHGPRERRLLAGNGILEAYIDLNIGEKALWTAFKQIRKKYARHITGRETRVGGYHNFSSTFSVKQFDLDLLNGFCNWESAEDILGVLNGADDLGALSLGSPKALQTRREKLLKFVDPANNGGPWLKPRPTGHLSKANKKVVRDNAEERFISSPLMMAIAEYSPKQANDPMPL